MPDQLYAIASVIFALFALVVSLAYLAKLA